MSKIIKKIKKFLKWLKRRILYRFNPDKLTKKQRKKVEKEIKNNKRDTFRGNILRILTGTYNLKIA